MGELIPATIQATASTTSALETKLLESPRNFSFVKATEMLQQTAPANGAVGFANAPADEVVRFRAVPSLGFPSADIDSCHKVNKDVVELHVNFMGLYGPSSPLPAYFTEAIIEEDVNCANQDARFYFLSNKAQIRDYQSQRIDVTRFENQASQTRKAIKAGTLDVVRLNDDQMIALKDGGELDVIINSDNLALFNARQLVIEVSEKAASRQRDFLDLFNHRLVSLFYRAAKKYQPYRDYESGGVDAFSEKVYALMGAPDAEQRERSALQWPRLLHFAGLLSMKHATKERIIKVLSGYFGLSDVRVKEGVFRWVDIPQDQQCALGRNNVVLGDSFMLGSKVADRCGKFRVMLGQLDLETFNQFLPACVALGEADSENQPGKHYYAINELLQFIKPSELLCDVELELRADKVPKFELNSDSPCRLGWSTWLGENDGQSPSVIVNNP